MLDFSYTVTDVNQNSRTDDVLHDHICDDCGILIKEMCDDGCTYTEELCAECNKDVLTESQIEQEEDEEDES